MQLRQPHSSSKSASGQLIGRTWVAIAVVTIILLAVSVVSVRAWFAGTAAANKLTGAATPTASAQLPVPVTAFITPGMRVAINAAQVSRTNLTPEVGCVVTNNGSEDLEELEILLLDFTANGKIDSVVGRKLNGPLKPGAAGSFSFTIERPIQPNHSLLVTIGAARGRSAAQQVGKLELLQGLIVLRSGGTPQGLVVRDLPRQQVPVDPNFCHTVFRIAHRLTNVPVAGYTCAQSQESFFIAFRN